MQLRGQTTFTQSARFVRSRRRMSGLGTVEPIVAQLLIGAGTTNVAPLVMLPTVPQAPAQIWSWDQQYAPGATIEDARLCIDIYSATGMPKYDPANPCNSNAQACLWTYWKIAAPCSAQTYSAVMFQQNRYIACQLALQQLLAAKPTTRDAQSVSAWVDWSLQIMRLVSAARWASNVRPAYQKPLAEMPRASAKIAEILSQLPVRPEPLNPRVSAFAGWNNAYDLTLFEPVLLTTGFAQQEVGSPRDWWLHFEGRGSNPLHSATTQDLVVGTVGGMSAPIPTLGLTSAPSSAEYFDPHGPSLQQVTRPHPGLPRPWYKGPTQPISPVLNPGYNQSIRATDDHVRLRALMTAWFSYSLGRAVWLRGDINWQLADGTWRTFTHWYGGAEALIQLCEAWALDVIETSFGAFVADGLKRFLTRYEQVPPQLRSLTQDNINQIRSGVEAAFGSSGVGVMTAAGIAAAAANAIPVAGQMLSAVIALIGALMQAVLELLKSLKIAAYGGGDVVAACIPPPVCRMIPTAESQACNFDPRDGQAEAVAARTQAVAVAAESGAPVETWHEVAAAASGERQASLHALLPPQPQRPNYWGWAAGAAVLAVGGALLYRAVR